jgi:ADP-heptose:LPS heptosyltransferase
MSGRPGRIQYALSSPRVVRALFEPLLAARGLRRRTPTLSNARRILVVRLDRIGDFVLSTPFLRALRLACPQADISLVVSPAVYPLARSCPHVSRTLPFDAGEPGKRLYRRWKTLTFARRYLWPLRCEWALLPRWDFDIWNGNFLAYFSGAPRRAGYPEGVSAIKASANKGADGLLTDCVRLDVAHRHEVLRNLGLLEGLGLSPGSPPLELWPTAQDERDADECLAQCGVQPRHRMLAVAPGSWEERKQWPLASYARLLDVLGRDADARCLILGGSEDRDLGQRLCEERAPAVVNLAGRLSLGGTAALLGRCVLYIGNDTGPKHMAAARGVPVVEISAHPEDGDPWNALSPRRFGAWQVPSRALQPRAGSRGIGSIDVDRVIRAAGELLVSARARPQVGV